MAQQNPKEQSTQYKNITFIPKLRKNRKIELRWGNKYYEAVKMAVFTTQYTPYMPAEPPRSIREEIDKTGYVCKQCRDCFRFLSSIEEHTSRRSWVLGFWCQHCFVTTCTHKANGKSNCSNCLDIETSKHDYLLSKGIKKNFKRGVTRVFYNQCQFFAHLRMHGINVVDLSDIMLMPLPTGIQPENYAQLDKAWKAVMEVMFIRRIHIMDWVKDKNISWNAILTSNPKQFDPIADIVSRYSEDCISVVDKSDNSRQDNPIQFEDSRRIAKSIGSHGNTNHTRIGSGDGRRNTIHIISTKSRDAREKVMRSDIAFVDCGPTPKNCISESPSASSSDRSTELSDRGSIAGDKEPPRAVAAKELPTRGNSLSLLFSQQYDKLREKSRDGAPKLNEDRTESSSLPSISRTGPRVLTIRSPRSLSISTIMKHLPNEGMNRKKVVVVGEDSKTENGSSESSESLGGKRDHPAATAESKIVDSTPPLVPIVPRPNDTASKSVTKAKIVASSNLLVSHKNKPGTAPNAVSQSFSEQMSLHGKIVFQNGRKYIIRHVPKAKYQSIVKDSLAAKKVSSPPRLTVPVSKRLLLPRPEPLAISLPPATIAPVTISGAIGQKSIIINRQLKTSNILTKIANPVGFSLVPVKQVLPIQDAKSRTSKVHKSLIVKIRDSMRKELQDTSKNELDLYVENLKEINEAYVKSVGADNNAITSSNLNVIHRFEKLASSAPPAKVVSNESDVPAEDAFEKAAKDWELNIMNSETRTCETCGKRVKPATYIVGMSGPASNESLYCQCYNYICYLCNTNQGGLIQLKAHIKWHKGKKPFMCPDCSIVFKTASDLEVHVWTTCFHPMARHIYGCSVCEIGGILDMESVAKHFMLLHTRRKIICSECKMEYTEQAPSLADYKLHFTKHHRNTSQITEPKRLLLCNLKQCIVRPELFKSHLSDHVGVLKWIYYKCPFCKMVTQGTGRNRMMIREHLIQYHLDRLHEVVRYESLPLILKGIHNPPTCFVPVLQTLTSSSDKVSQVSNANTSGPMIINARTITPESFEHGSEGSQQQQQTDSKIPKILEVRSEATEEFEKSASTENDFTMQIIAVESMSENLPELPTPKSETSDVLSRESMSDEVASLSEDTSARVGLKIFSSPLKDVVEDASNSNEDMTTALEQYSYEQTTEALDYAYSPPELKRKPSASLEANDESQEWYITEEFQKDFLTTYQSKSARRPWRIALNSPTSMETSPVAYNCHVCGELINTSWSVIKSHFSSRHAGDYELSVVSPQIPQISPGYIEGGYREDGSVPKRKSEGLITPGPKRRRRWGPKKYFEKPGSPSLGLCVRPEPVREVEGSFICKKCDEPFDKISRMREHIATNHRIKGQYLICLECGENFVVVPSLQMHLKALHGIQDPITYLTQNTAYAPDTPEDTDEEERTTEANQCYVCMAVFEDKAAVDKHIRVHGMAFLKRKRFEAQKAQKCWEKKGEPPGANSNAVSPHNKLKDEEDTSKLSPNNVATSNCNSDPGISNDSTRNVQQPLKFWVKKFDTAESSNISASSDDKSHNTQDCTSATESTTPGLLEITGTS